MARYRLKQTAYLKPHPQSPVPMLLDEGDEVDLPEYPGPYVDPLDDAARAAADAYAAAHPGATLDPTRRLGLSVAHDGLDRVVQARLDAMLAEAQAGRRPAGPDRDAEIGELRAQLAAMQAQIAALTAAPAGKPGRGQP